MRRGAIFVLLAGRVHPADWTQARNAHPQPKADTMTEMLALEEHIRTRRAKHHVKHAHLESTGYNNPEETKSCTSRRVTAVKAVRSARTAALKESPMKMDAMLVLPAEPARAGGCLQGIRVHHVLRADTMTGRRRAAVPKEPTRMRRAKRRASHAHLENMESQAMRSTHRLPTAA